MKYQTIKDLMLGDAEPYVTTSWQHYFFIKKDKQQGNSEPKNAYCENPEWVEQNKLQISKYLTQCYM